MSASRRLAAWLTASAFLIAACGGDEGVPAPLSSVFGDMQTTTSTSTPTPPPVASQPTTSTTAVAAVAVKTTTTTRAPRPRVVHEQEWTPFASVEGVVLHHPSRRVELVGFHESNHDGSRELEVLPTAADPRTLETRKRGTSARSAADVVSDPGTEIRSPVTGRVKRSGTYVLYCRYRDDYLVVEPDDRPGWEVKLIHIDGVRVRAGDRVVAGETIVAPRLTRLPFDSQVDEVTASPPWPHVHIEVVDPSIPDRPSPGGGC